MPAVPLFHKMPWGSGQVNHHWMVIVWSCFLGGLRLLAGHFDQCHSCHSCNRPSLPFFVVKLQHRQLFCLMLVLSVNQVRNLCPYALRGCQILQNVCNNPEMNPEYMEEWMVDRVCMCDTASFQKFSDYFTYQVTLLSVEVEIHGEIHLNMRLRILFEKFLLV